MAEVIGRFGDLDTEIGRGGPHQREHMFALLEAVFEMGYRVGDNKWGHGADEVAGALVDAGAVGAELGAALGRMAELRDRLLDDDDDVSDAELAGFWSAHREAVRAVVAAVADYLGSRASG